MIYFDSAASTSPRAEVLECFAKSNVELYANPSSTHAAGRLCARRLEQARKELLDAFGLAKTHKAIFLSGATEANNLALKGVARTYDNRGKKILVSATEHPSVLRPAEYLAKALGFELVVLPVNDLGLVEPDTLRQAMDKNVVLVSIMGVNNETGAINDLAALAKIVREYPKAFFHSDLTQAVGKTDVPYQDIDLFSFSAHKLHGLKGSGALIYRSNLRLTPTSHGGGQEEGVRSGTESVAMAEALSLTVRLAMQEKEANKAHVSMLWHALKDGLRDLDVRLNSYDGGSPYVMNFSLLRHKASVIVEGLSQKEIYVSSASACSSKTDRTSSVLRAMGKSEGDAGNAIRVSFDRSNSLDEVKTLLDTLTTLLKEVRPR